MKTSRKPLIIRTKSRNATLVSVKRKQIMRFAVALFYKQGYHRTTMKQIARASKLPIGAIYHYIGSKDDILHLIVQYSASTTEKLQKFMKNFMERYPDINYVDVLLKCHRKYIEIVNNQSDIFLFFSHEIVNLHKRDRDELLKDFYNTVEFFHDRIRAGIEAGEFKKIESPYLLAHNMAITAVSFSRERWYLKTRYSVEEYMKGQAEILRHVLLTCPSPTKV